MHSSELRNGLHESLGFNGEVMPASPVNGCRSHSRCRIRIAEVFEDALGHGLDIIWLRDESSFAGNNQVFGCAHESRCNNRDACSQGLQNNQSISLPHRREDMQIARSIYVSDSRLIHVPEKSDRLKTLVPHALLESRALRAIPCDEKVQLSELATYSFEDRDSLRRALSLHQLTHVAQSRPVQVKSLDCGASHLVTQCDAPIRVELCRQLDSGDSFWLATQRFEVALAPDRSRNQSSRSSDNPATVRTFKPAEGVGEICPIVHDYHANAPTRTEYHHLCYSKRKAAGD